MLYFSQSTPNGYLYCVRFDKVERADFLPCSDCPHFAGAYQGLGRECLVGENDGEEIVISDPYAYMNSKRVAPDVEE